MRDLNKKQMKILRKWFNEHKEELTYNNIWDKMDYNMYEELQEIHDFEMIYQAVQGYIEELINEEIDKFEQKYRKW